jgi:kynureninase
MGGSERSTRRSAAYHDAADPLSGFRERFVMDPDVVYLDGNSLGCLPRATLGRLESVLSREWGVRGIRAWNEGWLDLPLGVGDLIGEAVLGAAPGQVAAGDSTTVCFYKLASAALDARADRREILTDADNFPTDRYVLAGLAEARGLEVVWLSGGGCDGPSVDAVASAASERTALVTFSHVSYRSASVADMAGIGAAAREAGALTLWDLSHSAGSVPLALDADRAQLAVGCTYKYLNGGPGAPAYMYACRDLQEELHQPIWGWLGHSDPFGMEPGFAPAQDMRRFLSGTPPVLGLAAVEEGVRVVQEAGMEAIRAKAIALTELAIALTDAVLAPLGVRVASPRDSARRGAHVAVSHPDAAALCEALIERGVIVDFRGPDVIRLGLSPLTTRFVDVWDGIEALRRLLAGA